ncbi:replication initiation protein [Lactobacillus sp. AN1001]
MSNEDKLEKLRERLVAEHNDLIRSTADMTLTSLKLFEVAVSAVDSVNGGKNKVRIDKKQLFDSLGVSGVNRNRNLTYALQRLIADATFNVTFYDENDNPTDVTIKPIYAFQNAHNSAYIEMTFAPEILPFITELKNNFTRYRLDDVLKMRS